MQKKQPSDHSLCENSLIFLIPENCSPDGNIFTKIQAMGKTGLSEKKHMNTQHIRRKDRIMPIDKALELLRHGEYGVLASVDEQGQSYGTPLSFVYEDKNKKIYFHSAKEGHKISNIRANNRVCFTVVGQVRAVYENNFTTCYESVIVFGTVSEVSDPQEKHAALYGLARKYLPEHLDMADEHIRASWQRTAVFAIHPESISAKAKRV